MAHKLTKPELTEVAKEWLENFLSEKYGKKYEISVIIPDRTLNLLNNQDLKRIKNIPFFTFKPDLLGILKNKKDKSIEIVMVNRELKSIGLRELGEMQCYCRLAKPFLAMWITLQGLTGPMDKMINHNKKQDILKYDDKKMIVLRYDPYKKEMDQFAISPVEYRDFIFS